MIFFVLSQRAHALQAHRGANREEKMWACLDRLCATYDLLWQTHTHSQKEETRLNWHGHSLALAHFFAIFLTGACACMYVSVCESGTRESFFLAHFFFFSGFLFHPLSKRLLLCLIDRVNCKNSRKTKKRHKQQQQ